MIRQRYLSHRYARKMLFREWFRGREVLAVLGDGD